MTQASLSYQVNPRFVPGDIPLWMGNAKDSAIIYDATADELSLQTQNASSVLTDRIRVESGTDTPFVELAAGRMRLLDAAADPGAAGEIFRNGADLKVYSGGAVRSLSNITGGLANVVEDTTPQLGGDLDCQNNDLNNIGAAGNDWTADSLTLNSANSGGNTIISVDNSSNTANSSARVLLRVAGSSAGDAYITIMEQGSHELSFGLDTSASRFSMSASGALGSNDVMRITDATPPVITYNTTHPTGTFDYVCEGCGKNGSTEFECCGRVTWHDDQLAVFRFLNGIPGSYDQMVRLGIMEYDSETDQCPPANGNVPWRGWNPWQSQIYTWSMIGQERLRSEFYNHRAELVLDWHEHRLDDHELFTETILADHRERLLTLEQELVATKAALADLKG